MANELRIARTDRTVQPASGPLRHFVGLRAAPHSDTLLGSLVQVTGQGLTSRAETIATARLSDPRMVDHPDEASRSVEVAALAAQVVQQLLECLRNDVTTLRTVALDGLGDWICDPLGAWRFRTRCDTAVLAAETGLSIVDDFVSGDLASGGRGGPGETVGAWLILADRGLVPGRIIRALVDVSGTMRLYLLPPRQREQLPSHLMSVDVAPGAAFLSDLARLLTHDSTVFNARETWSVQGRKIPPLVDAWQLAYQQIRSGDQSWVPTSNDTRPLLQVVADWSDDLSQAPADVMCSAVHWITDRLERVVHERLPRSQPVGQIILAGTLREHSFLLSRISQQLPEIAVTCIDDMHSPGEYWTSTATALLGMMFVDQVPANSASISGVDTPRVLGRVTPGKPSNWHRVLSDMSVTLPLKKTLRSAV